MTLEKYSGCFSDFKWPWYRPSVDEYSTVVKSGAPRNLKVWDENVDRYFPDTETM
jgi:trans-aconitate 2-methyltransferase